MVASVHKTVAIDARGRRDPTYEYALVQTDTGGVERSLRALRRRLTTSKLGMGLILFTGFGVMKFSIGEILAWFGVLVPNLSIVFEMGLAGFFGVAMILPLIPLNDRWNNRLRCVKGLSICKKRDSLSLAGKEQEIDLLEVALTASNYLGESERIEYAGRLALHLIELGEIKRAFLLMADAQKAAFEMRRKIVSLWWLPSFRSERKALKKLDLHERLIDSTIGITGELVIALFHFLGSDRIIDQSLCDPASLKRLVEVAEVHREGDVMQDRQTKVLISAIELFDLDDDCSQERASDVWIRVEDRLVQESRCDHVPILALLALAQASLHLEEAKNAWKRAIEFNECNKVDLIRSLLPAAFEQSEDVFRSHR